MKKTSTLTNPKGEVTPAPLEREAKILTIVGARPNFIKAAALHRALQALPGVVSKIVHTGQHAEAAMSDVFFQELDLPTPDAQLGVQYNNANQLMARTMLLLEPVLEREKPDWVVVIGDVNSTLAAALTAHQMGFPLAHVEAGLRSFDRSMPEENNRILSDALADLLFVTEPQGLLNLEREGLSDKKMHLVGNCMIDTLQQYREKAAATRAFERSGLPDRGYALLTFHRPVNVDTPAALLRLLELVAGICDQYPAIWPLHPRTRNSLQKHGLLPRLLAQPRLSLCEPLGYLSFIDLLKHAAVAITDSGGVQVESSALNIPTITLRNTTESVVCVEQGSNVLLPDGDPAGLTQLLEQVRAGAWKQSALPVSWDGRAAERMANILGAA